ncbi:MAG: TetR/AcrR family transcriptional regulator [Solirubrobacteraceae bacterium]
MRRIWIVAAAAKICFESGPDAVSLAYAAERSGLGSQEVSTLFPTPEDLLQATFDKAAAVGAEYIIPRFAAEPDPVEKVRLVTAHLLAFCAAEPELSWVCVADCEATREARVRMARILGQIVADWFKEFPTDDADALAATRTVARVMQLVAEALHEQTSESVGRLYPALVEALVSPFIGAPSARIVAARPAPEVRPPDAPIGPSGDPVGLDVRLTVDLVDELAALSQAR